MLFRNLLAPFARALAPRGWVIPLLLGGLAAGQGVRSPRRPMQRPGMLQAPMEPPAPPPAPPPQNQNLFEQAIKLARAYSPTGGSHRRPAGARAPGQGSAPAPAAGSGTPAQLGSAAPPPGPDPVQPNAETGQAGAAAPGPDLGRSAQLMQTETAAADVAAQQRDGGGLNPFDVLNVG